ncbi:MAG: hypothetical protein V2A73_07795 [Pseudomonadota bacterium]
MSTNMSTSMSTSMNTSLNGSAGSRRNDRALWRLGVSVLVVGSALGCHGLGDGDLGDEERVGRVSLPVVGPGKLVEQPLVQPMSAPVYPDQRGYSIAIDGNTVAVGAACSSNGSGFLNGHALVLVGGEAGWSEQARLLGKDTSMGDSLGAAVAVSGNTALVGASGDESAYFFERADTTWTESEKEVPSSSRGDFGFAVALSGSVAVVGAPGSRAAHVLEKTETQGWVEIELLTASDSVDGDRFGAAVALSSDTVIVGAPTGNSGATIRAGAVYSFVRSQDWKESKIDRGGIATGYEYGAAVALSGDTLLVGSPMATAGGQVGAGCAFAFVRDGAGSWQAQGDALECGTPAPGDQCGYAVAVDGDLAVLGAPHRDNGASAAESGMIFAFVRSEGSWNSLPGVVGATTVARDRLGFSVGLSGSIAVAGAPFKASSAGGVHVFRYLLGLGAACDSDDQCESGHCGGYVCCDAQCGTADAAIVDGSPRPDALPSDAGGADALPPVVVDARAADAASASDSAPQAVDAPATSVDAEVPERDALFDDALPDAAQPRDAQAARDGGEAPESGGGCGCRLGRQGSDRPNRGELLVAGLVAMALIVRRRLGGAPR